MNRTRERPTAAFAVADGFAGLAPTSMVVDSPAPGKHRTDLEEIEPPDPPLDPGTTRDVGEPVRAGRSQG